MSPKTIPSARCCWGCQAELSQVLPSPAINTCSPREPWPAQAEKGNPELQESPTVKKKASKGKKRKKIYSRHLWIILMELRQPQEGNELLRVTNFPAHIPQGAAATPHAQPRARGPTEPCPQSGVSCCPSPTLSCQAESHSCAAVTSVTVPGNTCKSAFYQSPE